MEETSAVRKPSDELQTHVHSELLRGASLDVCLAGFGRHFAATDPGMFKVSHRLYKLSKKMDRFHAFLSHDWKTSRWLKLMSLLVIYNSRAAFVSSLIVSVFVGTLRAAQILPDALWITALVYAVFPLIFCFWQRIRTHILQLPVTMFFDKLCIAQHDEDLKQQGVFGLAGFLDHSDQLTVLWSGRYFSRLWCTYEISTFLRDSEKHKPILVMPVKLALILVIFSAALNLVNLGFSILYDVRSSNPGWGISFSGLLKGEFRDRMIENALYMPFLGPVMPFLYYVGIGMIEELAALPKQLREFRVQNAACFCCANGHRNPVNGEAMPCDRELIFRMLKRWYGKASNGEEAHLERFNQLVQETLAPRVLGNMGPDMLPWNYCFYMVVPVSFPALTLLIPKIAAGHPELMSFQQVIWSLRLILGWSKSGILSLFCIRASMGIWLATVRCLPQRHFSRCRPVLSLLLTIPAGILMTAILFSIDISMVVSEDDSLLPLIPCMFWLLVLCGLSCQSSCNGAVGRKIDAHALNIWQTGNSVEDDSISSFSV